MDKVFGDGGKAIGAVARAERVLWFCLLLSVPVSASPLLPFGSGTLVRPLAMAPAILLLLLGAFRILFLRQRPDFGAGRDGLVLLFLFTAYVVISGLARIAFLPGEDFKGQTPLDSFVRALVTLLAGIGFYLVARLHIRTADDIRRTIRTLFIGMSASIVLAAVQVLAIIRQGQLLHITQTVTDLFAVHYDGLTNRAQGMTFEPSWLATQIIVLLLPILIARSITWQDSVGVPAAKGHVVRLIAGFGIAVVGLLAAGSRFGLACVVAMLVLSGLLAMRYGKGIAALSFVVVLATGLGGLAAMSSLRVGAGASYVLGPINYLTGTADLETRNGDVATFVTDALAMAGRVSAAQAALGMWLDHPAWGVSLGNSYRYFGRFAPDWVYATQLFAQGNKEGVGWLDPNSPEKGNAKNLFLRLLSETGVIGFVLFTAFLMRQIFASPARDRFHGIFRAATAAALLFGFFNQDSFADPVFWIPLVLCFAMGRLNNLPSAAAEDAGFAS